MPTRPCVLLSPSLFGSHGFFFFFFGSLYLHTFKGGFWLEALPVTRRGSPADIPPRLGCGNCCLPVKLSIESGFRSNGQYSRNETGHVVTSCLSHRLYIGFSEEVTQIPRGEICPGETQCRWSDGLRSRRSDLRSVMAFLFCLIFVFSAWSGEALQVYRGQVVEKSHPGSPYGDSEFPIGKSLWPHSAHISQAMAQFPRLTTKQSFSNNQQYCISHITYHIE